MCRVLDIKNSPSQDGEFFIIEGYEAQAGCVRCQSRIFPSPSTRSSSGGRWLEKRWAVRVQA